MSSSKQSTHQIMEMARHLNVHLTLEQVSAVEKMIELGVSSVNLVRLIQELSTPPAQNSSPSNRENALH